MKPTVSGCSFVGSLLIGLVTLHPAQAQIVPDTTLPTNSRVTPGCVHCVISGGTIRGVNLFHSFREFSVATGGSAWFNNAATIQNIVTRVTGNSSSNIDGLLKANSTANLFLLNPNGISFGSNTRLAIGGSFFASTAARFVFADGTEFSATNPQAPPLLTIDLVPGLQYGNSQPGATIANRGDLSTGQDLTLNADQLDLQGQLQAGRNLILQAQDRVQIQDTITTPLLAQSGANLTIEGSVVNISALNHPASLISAGQDLRLRSINPVVGDARFLAGGNFEVEANDQTAGDLVSPHDPIVLAVGNVSIGNYTGASLHILAGGSVQLGNVSINAPGAADTTINPTNDGLISGTTTAYSQLSTATLSDGQTVVRVSRNTQPTLDVRAGIDWQQLPFTGVPTIATPVTFPAGSVIFRPPILTDTAIQTGSIRITQPNGLVYLTNQYHSRSSGNSNIAVTRIDTRNPVGSGAVFIDSRSSILSNTPNPNTSWILASGSQTGYAGNISLLAGDTIRLTNGEVVDSSGSDSANAGNITVQSRNLLLTNGANLTANAIGQGRGGNLNLRVADTIQLLGVNQATQPSGLNTQTWGLGHAGNIDIVTGRLLVQGGAQIATATFGEQPAGNLSITASDRIQVSGTSRNGRGSILMTGTSGSGNAGNLTIQTGDLVVKDGGLVSTVTYQAGKAGNLSIQASGTISVLTERPIYTGIYTSTFNRGDAGDLNLAAQRLIVQGMGRISSEGFETSSGQAGNLTVTTPATIELTGMDGLASAGLFSSNYGSGSSGNLTVNTGRLVLQHGALISSGTFGQYGQSGNLTVAANEAIELVGTKVDNEGVWRSTALNTSTYGTQAGGSLTITTPRLVLQDGAQVFADTSGSGHGGDLKVMAAEVEIQGTSANGEFSSSLSARSRNDWRRGLRATGDSGNIYVATDRLTLSEGGQISVSTESDGNAGNLTIQATDAVTILGNPPIGRLGLYSGIFGQVIPGGRGNAGNLEINTRALTLQDNGSISTSVHGNAQGTAGQLTVHAIDSIMLNGQDGGIYSTVQAGGIGNGGNIHLFTPQLTLDQGSEISTRVDGQGRAGNIQINADRLTLQHQAQVSATTSSGAGGSITVIANTIDASSGGRLQTTTFGQSDAGSLSLYLRDRLQLSGTDTGLFADTEVGSSGNGGNIFIDPQQITLQNGAAIAVNSRGTGQGGNITIEANRLSLDRGATISAETGSNQGGNITLQIHDLLLLRHHSTISATAGTRQTGGNGGNITIVSPFIVGVLSENSDITANAFTGKGGNINITANGIFGLRFQPTLTPNSDITASSRFGLSGTVTLNLLNLDPSQGLVALPVDVIDPSSQIHDRCSRQANRSSTFIQTGRGGIPPSPNDPLRNAAVVIDWVTLHDASDRAVQFPSAQTTPVATSAPSRPIVEAQGWVTSQDGAIYLVTQAPNALPHATWQNSVNCMSKP